MNREETLGIFIKEDLKSASKEFLSSTMLHLSKENKKETAMKFAQSVVKIINQAPSLRFLQLVMLRFKALTGMPFYRFEAYGEGLYLMEPLAVAMVDLEWLYQAYNQFTSCLDNGSRRYLGKIGEDELNRIKMAQLWTCQKIVRHLFYEAIPYLFQSKEYQNLNVEKKIQFHLGEYKGKYEVLLTKDEITERLRGMLCELLLD